MLLVLNIIGLVMIGLAYLTAISSEKNLPEGEFSSAAICSIKNKSTVVLKAGGVLAFIVMLGIQIITLLTS